MEDQPTWVLAGEYRGHGEDVRAVVVAGSHGVATASRDKTLRLWPFPSSPPSADAGPLIYVGHEHFVSALAWAEPGVLAEAPEGALLSGSRDTHVIVWHTQSAQLLHRLSGHKLQACLRPAQPPVARHSDSASPHAPLSPSRSPPSAPSPPAAW